MVFALVAQGACARVEAGRDRLDRRAGGGRGLRGFRTVVTGQTRRGDGHRWLAFEWQHSPDAAVDQLEQPHATR